MVWDVDATMEDLMLRMALCGPSGSGKTWTALEVAFGMAGPNGRVGIMDSENKSGKYYSKYFPKYRWEPIDENQSVDQYIKLIRAAYGSLDALVIDSFSHAWMGAGGALEEAGKIGARIKNDWAAWRDINPKLRMLIRVIQQGPFHIIATLRVHTEWETEKKAEGGIKVKKLGLSPEMRKGIDYEFDIVGDIDQEHRIIITKTRCVELDGFVEIKPKDNLIQPIRQWLELDKSRPTVKPSPEVTPEVTPETSPEQSLYGNRDLACPEIAMMMDRLHNTFIPGGKPGASKDELFAAYDAALMELCLEFNVDAVHDMTAEQAPAFEEFVRRQLTAKLRASGHFPQARERA